jgi:tetraacyldisaccharide 4'-kinase
MDLEEYRGVVSGAARGFKPSLLRGLLSAASAGYGLAVWCRNLAFELGLLSVQSAPVPVVSVGNLTVGGTGKTPFAAWLAAWFMERGVRVCFVSRGYAAGRQAGAGAASVNDEGLLLERLCPNVPHVQNADRIAAARMARSEHRAGLIILDDGFQHRRIARDLDILLVDATNPFGHGRLLPRGFLREPVSAMARASVVVLTRVDQAGHDALERLLRLIAKIHPQAVVVQASFVPDRLLSASGKTASLASLRAAPVAAFSGIGNPEAFEAGIRLLGMKLLAARRLGDHYPYTAADLQDLAAWCTQLKPAAVLTTQKDLVKLDLDRLAETPLWAVCTETRIVQGGARLEARLEEIRRRCPVDEE